MRVITDIFLIAFAIGFWLLLSEFATGAPTTLINYYAGEYNSTTGGSILRSRVDSKRWGSETYYIKYSYIVSNKHYMSDQVNFMANNTAVARETVERYPEGIEVNVYYDGSKPMYAALEVTELEFEVWGQMLAALLMGLVSITLLPLNGIKNFRES